MDNEKKAHEGEILMLLVKRSGKEGKDVAKQMGINQSYLSKIFNLQSLTPKIKRAASQVLGVDEAVFEQGVGYVLPEAATQQVSEPRGKYEKGSGLSAAEVARLMEEHSKERARLLAIIEKLVAK